MSRLENNIKQQMKSLIRSAIDYGYKEDLINDILKNALTRYFEYYDGSVEYCVELALQDALEEGTIEDYNI